MARQGPVRLGKAGVARHGLARLGPARHGMAWYGWHGVAVHGVARRGAVRSGAVRCGLVWQEINKGGEIVAASKYAEKYTWANGYPAKVSAETAGRVCSELAGKGCLTAEKLVKVSRPENAPLHAAFEWNDQIAAESFRQYQARTLIHSVRIVKPDNIEPQRIFLHIECGDPQYRAVNVILSDQEMTNKMLKMAYGELIAFRKKYSQLSALSGVFDAIDELTIQ